MGRKPKEVDVVKLLEMSEAGMTLKDMSQQTRISEPTLRKRIQEVQAQQGIILEAQEVETLRISNSKSKILTYIENNMHHFDTDQMLKTLSVLDKMEKDKDANKNEKERNGLLGFIVAVEKKDKEEKAKLAAASLSDPDEVIDVEPSEQLPRL